jgi:hypothetical protein
MSPQFRWPSTLPCTSIRWTQQWTGLKGFTGFNQKNYYILIFQPAAVILYLEVKILYIDLGFSCESCSFFFALIL